MLQKDLHNSFGNIHEDIFCYIYYHLTYIIYNITDNTFDMIFEDIMTNTLLYKHTTPSIGKTIQIFPTDCENIVFFAVNDDVYIVNVVTNAEFHDKIFKLRFLLASSNGKSFF